MSDVVKKSSAKKREAKVIPKDWRYVDLSKQEKYWYVG